MNFSKSRVSCRPSFPESGDAVRIFFSTFCCAAPFAVIVLKFLNQFTAPCDALWAWPFSSPRAGTILFFFLTSFCPRDLGLSLPREWFGRFCQVPATLHGFSWPFQKIKGFHSDPLFTQCGLQAGANPAPASLCMLILVLGSCGC